MAVSLGKRSADDQSRLTGNGAQYAQKRQAVAAAQGQSEHDAVRVEPRDLELCLRSVDGIADDFNVARSGQILKRLFQVMQINVDEVQSGLLHERHSFPKVNLLLKRNIRAS